MAFSGFKKTMGKTTQYLSEKIGNKEGSKTDEDFVELERITDNTARCMENINNKVMDFLQPNPVTRAKLATQATYARARGTAIETGYPQTERTVGEILTKSAEDIGTSSYYGRAVVELGEGFMKLADVKDSLDCDIKQNFIDPMEQTIKTDYKESIQGHRKKMNSRRLDYDYKISQHEKGRVTEDELYTAEDKFNESMQMSDVGMKKFVQAQEEHIHQLQALVGFIKNYHENALRILDEVQSNIQEHAASAQSMPKEEGRPVARISSVMARTSISSPSEPRPMKPAAGPAPPAKPEAARPVAKAKALFDFEAENPTELDLKENDIVILIKQIDDNWFEGEVNGRQGFFPTNYVEVIIPL
ncbi:endophilin-A3-like [Bolinopsis microptera]|uniref:endophilin-A3-like n=1 Tax=Bolinopsis microptera TaxID=2820187 RepID=UPI003078EE28